MYPFDESTPAQNAVAIANELEQFSPALAQRERWLVLNKIDMVPEDEREALVDSVVSALDWEGPVYVISALASDGTQALVRDLMLWLEEHRQSLIDDPDLLEADTEHRDQVEREARERIQTLAERRHSKRKAEQAEDDEFDDDDDDHDVEIIYTP
jgi:GTP-binding protein